MQLIINKNLANTKIEIYIVYFALFTISIIPLLGFDRETNFNLFTIIVTMLCMLSQKISFNLFIVFLPIPFVSTIGSFNLNLLDIISFFLLLHLFITKQKPIPKKFIWFDNLLILYYLFSLIIIINSSSINIAVIIRYIIEPLIVYFSAKILINSKKDLLLIAKLLIVGTLFSSLVCIYQFTNIFNLEAWQKQYMFMINYGIYPDLSASYRKENIFYRRPGGFFQYGAELATFIPIVFFFILYLIKENKFKRIKFFLFCIILAILFTALVLTTVRGMVFAFIISVIAYILINSKNRILTFLILPIVIFITSYNLMPQYMIDRYLLRAKVETMYTRIGLAKESLSEINNIQTLLIGTTDPKSHNKFVDELHAKGIFGLIIYLALQLKLFKYSLNKRKRLFLFPLLIFWLAVSFTTGAPYGTFHTHFLFPIVLIMSIIV